MTIEERFTEFVRSLQSAELVDELQLNQEQRCAKKADFFFLDRQLIGEMKCITKDMKPKAQAVLDRQEDRPEYPMFYGVWDSNKVLKHLPDGEKIKQEVFYSTTSALEEYVEKANRQIRTTKETFKLQDSEGILIILNDCVDILSPYVIAYRINQLLHKKTPTGDIRHSHISAVWIIDDLHVVETEIDQDILLSIVVESKGSISQETADYINWLQKKWADFNNVPFIKGKFDFKGQQFSKRKDDDLSEELYPPGMIPRNEMWKRQYLKTPYLRHLTQEMLLDHAQQIFYAVLPKFILGEHEKPLEEKVHKNMELHTHLMEEINHRGIDFREFSIKLREALTLLQKEGKIKMKGRSINNSEQIDNSPEEDRN
jgi:hypothetical protein